MGKWKFLQLTLAAFLLGTSAANAAWPERNVRFIVPFAPGGSNDFHTRVVAEKLQQMFNQPFVVDNIAGGTGQIGYLAAARAAPDGHTIVMGTGGLTILPSLYTKMQFDPRKDLQPVSQVVRIQNVMVVPSSLPPKNVQEFIAYAKAAPKNLDFASSGVGNPPHLSAELFKTMAQVQMNHIPYRLDVAALPDLLAGRVHMFMCPISTCLEHIRSNQLRALAVTSTARAVSMADTPTIAEAGLPGYDVASWFGILAPAGTPKAIVETLNAAVAKIVAMPDVREKFIAAGSDPTGTSVAEFQSVIDKNFVDFAKIIKDAGVKPIE